MNDIDFLTKVDVVINRIAQIIEDNDIECKYEIDLHDGILSFSNENGTYVINRQTIAKEIWLSSPVSGPYHFVLKDDMWESRKGANLFLVLGSELNIPIDELV